MVLSMLLDAFSLRHVAVELLTQSVHEFLGCFSGATSWVPRRPQLPGQISSVKPSVVRPSKARWPSRRAVGRRGWRAHARLKQLLKPRLDAGRRWRPCSTDDCSGLASYGGRWADAHACSSWARPGGLRARARSLRALFGVLAGSKPYLTKSVAAAEKGTLAKTLRI